MATSTNKPASSRPTTQSATNDGLPKTGFVRIWQITGNPKADPPIPALIPVGNSTIYRMVREGRFPKPVKLAKMTTAWKVEEVREWLAQQGQRAA